MKKKPILLADLVKLSATSWQIPRSFRSDMQVAANIFTNERLLTELFKDNSLQQLVNVATLPGLYGNVLVMPDGHEGYGFPIGGVAAMRYPEGVISPGGIGYDINCGVRLLKSTITYPELMPHQGALACAIYQAIPAGAGRRGTVALSIHKLDQVLQQGAAWAVAQGYGDNEDLDYIESNGCLAEAAPHYVSAQAKARGHQQLGTLGSGNHFIEVDKVSEIYDAHKARLFGLFAGQIVLLIHTGSRGLGHQVATDYIKLMLKNSDRYPMVLADRELACAPFNSPEGSHYFQAMASAANFAWANRQVITHQLRQVWHSIFAKAGDLKLLYDVAHNIAKIEQHQLGNESQKLIIHRKGATRAFGPSHPELPLVYQPTGQPVIIPGSMGTASYVLAGTDTAMQQSFGSSCHGAGRHLSRHEAKRRIQGSVLQQELATKGIIVTTGSVKGLAEEAPMAYKDVDEVIQVVHDAKIATKVVKLEPLVVIKG